MYNTERARKKCTFKKTLYSFDIFPIPTPSFNVEGKTTISSKLGSLLGMWVSLIMLFYGANKCGMMLVRKNPTVSSFTEPNAVGKEDVTSINYAGIRFAFGIEGFLDKQPKDDPRFVKWLVRQVTRVNGVETEKILPYRKCTNADYDSF